MAELLKGNFKAKKSVSPESRETNLEDRFEQEAMKRLGGSIAFVSKKKVKWDSQDKS